MEMDATECSRFMHFFTPILRDENSGANAKLQRKVQTQWRVDSCVVDWD